LTSKHERPSESERGERELLFMTPGSALVDEAGNDDDEALEAFAVELWNRLHPDQKREVGQR